MNSNFSKKLKIAAITSGCRLNQTDTALIYDRLSGTPCEIVDFDTTDAADILILNTCAVTSTACQKSRQLLHQMRRRFPSAFIIVTGCGADIQRSNWEEDKAADIVLSNVQKREIGKLINDFANSRLDKNQYAVPAEPPSQPSIFKEGAKAVFPFKTRMSLKIQEGCNSFCSYCIVPYARGRERSRDFNEIMIDFRNMIDSGAREIVLTGVNISTYSCEGLSLTKLISKLLEIPGNYRIRLSSMEPHQENHGILSLMQDDRRLCRFLHIPIQHASDPVLQRMNRRYRASEFLKFAAEAKTKIDGIHLGTDFITAFPGETDKDFNDALRVLKEIGFANMHVFTFSPREGTPAAKFTDKIPASVAKERHKILTELKKEMALNFISTQIEKKLIVLPESIKTAIASGYTDNYIKVKLNTKDKSFAAGEFLDCKASLILPDLSIKGELIEKFDYQNDK